MSSLHELQRAFGVALLGGDERRALAGVAADGLGPAARLAIYRHHVATTLTDVLADVYPVVRRLVGAGFFAYAADRFVSARPPAGPCLFEYGDGLAEFLAGFEPCRALAYLPDVARLEWALHAARHADDAPPIALDALAGIAPAALDRVALVFHPSVNLLASPWPVDRIWRAAQPETDPARTVDLAGGGVRLEVRRDDDQVLLRTLAGSAWTFRRALWSGRTLREAADATLAELAEFDLPLALHELFRDGAIIAVRLTTPDMEASA